MTPIDDDGEELLVRVCQSSVLYGHLIDVIQHHDHKHIRFEQYNEPVSSHCHEHVHSHGHDHGDMGMMGVLLHVLCDAANNLGVIAAALVIWLAKYDGRYYADPGTSMGIGLMIILSSIPLSTCYPLTLRGFGTNLTH